MKAREGRYSDSKNKGHSTFRKFSCPCIKCGKDIYWVTNFRCVTCNPRIITRFERDEFEEKAIYIGVKRPKGDYSRIGGAIHGGDYKPAIKGYWPPGVNYGGDPVLGLNDNTYPDMYPYNLSVTHIPLPEACIGCAAYQCVHA